MLQVRDQLFERSFLEHAENYEGNIADVFDIIADYELNANNRHNAADEIRRKDLFLSAWTIYLAGNISFFTSFNPYPELKVISLCHQYRATYIIIIIVDGRWIVILFLMTKGR